MDELEKKVPTDAWQTLFEDAAEAPPLRVWDAIEHRLDESSSTKIVPLWGTGLATSHSVLWGTGLAASVALLLLGWWAMHTPTLRPQSPLSGQRQTAMASLPLKRKEPVNVSLDEGHKHPAISGESAKYSTVALARKATRPTHRVAFLPQESDPDGAGNHLVLEPASGISDELLKTVSAVANTQAYSANNSMNKSGTSHLAATSFIQEGQSVPVSDQVGQIQFLAGKPIHLHEFGHIYRIVWFRPSEETVQPALSKSEHRNHDVWASASVMPGTFNPMVSVQLVSSVMPSATNNASLANNTAYQAPSVYSRTSFSVAYQVGAGMLLNERWALETGVGYLAGRSIVDTPTQLSANSFNATNGQKSTGGNLYVDALRTSDATNTSRDQANYTSAIATGYYTDQSRKKISNDYQFVQVPVQVSYQLRPRKRLNLAVLGGIISNIFVRNTVDNEVVVTTKDGIYRPVSFAAIMGARFRYQYSGQWSASLAGIYQPSIGLITQAHAQVQSQPNTAGMTFGVDYHF